MVDRCTIGHKCVFRINLGGVEGRESKIFVIYKLKIIIVNFIRYLQNIYKISIVLVA